MTSTCGCDKKRKYQTKDYSSPAKNKKPQTKNTTELEQQEKQRKKNRQLATKLAETGKRQLLQKYPLQQNVLTAPKFEGVHFPLKQNTQRMSNRAKINQKVDQQVKRIVQDMKK